MSQHIAAEQRDELTSTLYVLVEAFAGCDILLPTPHFSSVDTHLAKWVTLIDRAADILDEPDGIGGRSWTKSMGVVAAARGWTGAAGMHHLYLQIQMPAWERHFGLFMGRVTAELSTWRVAQV